MKRETSAVLLRMAAAFFCVLLCGVQAQMINGDLVGTVTDATGASLANATITATNEATGVKTSATTESSGQYRFTNLAVGSYTITAAASGFSTNSVKNVQVQLNNTLTQNFAMEVGSTATTVEVSAASAGIDTTTAQVQTSFVTRQLEDLPSAGLSRSINGAGIYNLSLLGAGVSSQGGVGQGTGPAIAGQRPESNTFYLDGVSNNNHYSTGPLVYVANEAVGELSILQNQFSPEFGGASGGVFNAIVKSGTNTIHGSIYEYAQNRNLNAVDATVAVQGLTSNPRYDNNRLGATIGGPIIKNKLFYFGNFEYNPIGQSAVPGSPLQAPTAAGLAALANIPGVNQTNLGVFQKYVPTAPVNDQGHVTVGGVAIPVGSLSFASPNFDTSYNAIVSVDYNLSDKDQLRGRYVYNKTSGIDAVANLPAFFQPSPTENNFGSFSEFHNFSPTLQNEFRAAFSRNFNQIGVGSQSFPGLSVFPNLQIVELNSLQIGPDPNTPTGSIQNLAQFQDDVTKVFGKHTFKGGYHFTDVILTNYFIQRVRGDYEYNTLQQYLFDLTPDSLGERSAGPSADPCGFLQNEAFFNDDWRVRSNLTLNLGVRYEYVTIPVASRTQQYSSPANIPGVLSFVEPKPSGNEWSPRVGFAYSPGSDGVWSIRGGFARSFDLSYANLTANAAPAFYQTTQDVNLTSNAPNFLAGGGLPGVSAGLPTSPDVARGQVSSFTFGRQRPYGLTYTLGVQRLLHKDYTIEVRYIGTKGVHLWNQTRLNAVSPVDAAHHLPTYTTMPSASTLASLGTTLADLQALPNNSLLGYGVVNNLVGYAPQGYSSYNGLAAQVTKRFSNSFSYIMAYTWSHLIDDATATNFSTYLSPRRAENFQNMQAETASSALDRRHRFTFTPIYDWRAFQNHNWFLKNLVSNWNFSGTYTYESPEYATVQSGVDSNLNGDTAGDRAIVNPSGAAKVGTGVTPYNAQGQSVAEGDPGIVAYVANNPNARYVQAGLGALTNAGRNTYPLHPTDNIDFSVLKRFSVTERVNFQIGCQFFNVLNHPQFTGGYLSDVSSNGYTNSRNDLLPQSPQFGRFDQFYSSNSRQLQGVAKITF